MQAEAGEATMVRADVMVWAVALGSLGPWDVQMQVGCGEVLEVSLSWVAALIWTELFFEIGQWAVAAEA